MHKIITITNIAISNSRRYQEQYHNNMIVTTSGIEAIKPGNKELISSGIINSIL